MKKRLISMLLTVLMVLSLFSGLTVNAHAATINGANTIEYTMGQGDYVLRICQKLGLNYYTCKDAIMILNNITDGQWNKLTVGRTLTLPASDYDALLISNGARTTTYNSGAAATTATTSNVTGTATTGTATTTTATTANYSASNADMLAYYLVPYTMSYGETVSGVCNSLGVNFSIFSPFIKQVNAISNWNTVRAGDTIVVPTPVCPSVGTTCYGVMQHKVASSDTAYGIVSAKGLSYNANERILKVLNQTDNLAALHAGTWFFYPVPLTVSVPGTGNPGSTATTTTTTTVTDGNGTTTTQTTTTAKLYKLTSGMTSSDGTMLFYVDSKPVTAAAAGAKVTVVTDTNSGKAIQSLTVKYSNGTADLHMTGDTFIMPGCDVRVDTEIKTGHDINISANYSGKASASVNEVSVQSAVKGAAVVIKSVDPNYEVSAVYAYYKKMISTSTKTALTVSSSHAFIMPDADVDVEAVLKPVSTYAFYVKEPTPARGSFYLQVNGNAVTRAAKGVTVTVVCKAIDGYEPTDISVTNVKTKANINVVNNTFTMPAADVEVSVTFGAKGNNILIMPSQIGSVYAYAAPAPATLDEDSSITEQNSDTPVYLAVYDPDTGARIDSGYKITYEVKRNSDGLLVSVDSNGKFTMPKGGVTVTPSITAISKATVKGTIKVYNTSTKQYEEVNSYSDCSFSLTYKDEGKEKRTEFTGKSSDKNASISVLEYVDIRFEANDGIAFAYYEITPIYASGSTLSTADQAELKLMVQEMKNEANTYGYFQIPDTEGKVSGYVIEAHFENGKVPIGPAAITGIGSVSYKVWSDGAWKSVNACNPGEKVLLIVTNGNGYKFDTDKYKSRLVVTRKDNGAHIELTPESTAALDENAHAYWFEMPASGVDIQATFDPAPFIITMKCKDETGKDLTGQGLWQIAIDWVPGVADNLTNWENFETQFEVAYGEYVTVAMTEAGWSKYDMVSFRIDGLEYTADQLNYFYNFQMIDDRAKDLTITAVLRPKQIAVHNLSAVYDVSKGGVEFLIIKSPSGYSDEYRKNSNNALNYVNKAVTGDTVAIVANSVNTKYTIVKAEDITVTPWGTDADRIVATEQYINTRGETGQPDSTIRVFTFVMPDSDVSVSVNFTGTKQRLIISVYDMDNNKLNGMVRLFANNVYQDVAGDTNFDDVAYKTPVQIVRSTLALSEGKVIKEVDIKTGTGKPVSYTDMTSAGEGIMFTMPELSSDDDYVWVIIRMDDQHYNVPTYVNTQQVKNGKFVLRKTPNETDPVYDWDDFDPGEVIYMFDVPDSGYEHLGLGELKVYVNGMNNAVNVVKVSEMTDSHVWKLVKPEGTVIIVAEFKEKEDAQITLTIKVFPNTATNTDDSSIMTGGKVKATVNGYTLDITEKDTINVLEGQTVTITSDSKGYTVARVLSQSGLGKLSGNVYTVPTRKQLKEATGGTGTTDEVYVALKNEKNTITKVSISGGDLTFSPAPNDDTRVTEYTPGTDLYIIARPNDGYKYPDSAEDIIVVDVNNKRLVPVNITDSDGNEIEGVYMIAGSELIPGGIAVNTTFAKDAIGYPITFVVHPDSEDVKASLTMDSMTTIITGTRIFYGIEGGSVITIKSASDGYDKVNISANGGKVSGSSFTVPYGQDNLQVDIYLTSNSNKINSGSMSNGSLIYASDPAMSNHYTNEAATGAPVFVKANGNLGYYLATQDLKITKSNDGSNVDVVQIEKDDDGNTVSNAFNDALASTGINLADITADWYFEMPAGGVKVNATFKAETMNSVTITIWDEQNNIEVTDLEVKVTVANAGSTTAVKSGDTVYATVKKTITVTMPSGSDYKATSTTSYKVKGTEGEEFIVNVVPIT